MNLFPMLAAAVALAGVAASAPSAPEPEGHLYVQVVRGTDDGQPKEKSWKRIGPKLGGSLARVFKWQHFYEVKQKSVPIAAGTTASVRMEGERELQIQFKSPREAELRLYRHGKLTRKETTHLGQGKGMSILGGDGEKDGWFVVVRPDKPTVE